ncbi:MAG: CAP domain-containing protein, partial [Chloroflexota bacterium]
GRAAENLGLVQGCNNGEAVAKNHEKMMAETPPNDGHRQNILDSRLKKVGIGVYRTLDGRVYYICDFTD